MSDVDTLTQMLEREPDSLVGVAMLTDALIEERDMTRSEADRYAEHVQQSARDARDLAAAAGYLAQDTPVRRSLHHLVQAMSGYPSHWPYTIVLVPGDGEVHAVDATLDGDEPTRVGYTATVHARWVCFYGRLFSTGRHVTGTPQKRRRRSR